MQKIKIQYSETMQGQGHNKFASVPRGNQQNVKISERTSLRKNGPSVLNYDEKEQKTKQKIRYEPLKGVNKKQGIE